MSQSRIRQAQTADIAQLARFEAEISAISFGGEAVTDLSFHANKLNKAMEKDGGGMLVLETDGAITGWLWMDLKTNFVTNERYVNFRSFYIAEGARGGAEAEELLKRGLALFSGKGARYVTGKVHSGNAAMRALYKKMGFAATHITMEYKYD